MAERQPPSLRAILHGLPRETLELPVEKWYELRNLTRQYWAIRWGLDECQKALARIQDCDAWSGVPAMMAVYQDERHPGRITIENFGAVEIDEDGGVLLISEDEIEQEEECNEGL